MLRDAGVERLRLFLLGAFETENHVAEADFVAVLEVGDDNALAVDVTAVGGVEVPKFVVVAFERDHGVVLGDGGVVEADEIVRRAADGHAIIGHLEPLALRGAGDD